MTALPSDPPADPAATLFRERYGASPTVIASAPGRVNLIGEHLDYNGGEVLPIAIERRTVVALRPIPGEESLASSATQEESGRFPARSAEPSGRWWDYVAGTARELAGRGVAVPAAELAVASDVPTGAGLSSSAALEMAAGLAYLAHAGEVEQFTLRALALVGQRVEAGFVGVASGIMDQFASALSEQGMALHLWCDTATFEHVPMRDAVLIFDTRVKRSLRSSAFNERRAECEQALAALRQLDPALPDLAHATLALLETARLPEPLASRARHVVTEMARVHDVVAALRETGTVPGQRLYESHESLRADYACSTPELDWFVEHAMRQDGVSGARLTGAGWGGCAIAVGAEAALAAAAPRLADEYAATFGRTPRTWITHAAPGAGVAFQGG